jgi:hypothetical protein
MNLAEQYSALYEDEANPNGPGPLSNYYQGVVEALLRVTET